MKSTKLFLNLIVLMAIVTFASCEKDDNGGTGDTSTSKYIIAATSGEHDYLLKGSRIDADTTYDATSSSALQATGDRFWNFYGDDVLFGFVYNQTDPGVTASYILGDDGVLAERNELSLALSIQTRGEANNKMILAYADRVRDTAAVQYGYFYEVNPETDASTLYTIETDDLLEEGEAAFFTDIAEYQGYMIAGARSITTPYFTSDYLNNTYVVVFNADYSVKQVIKDEGRTGFVAGMKYSQGKTGLEVVESGDLYVFSSGQTYYAVADSIIIPSGILKINEGDFAFDVDYFYNITEASGGYNLFRTYYMGGTTFVLKMYPGKGSDATFGIDADRFAVVDVAAETFAWVTGFPSASGTTDDPFSVGQPFIDTENDQLVVPVTNSSNNHYLYSIDPSDATSTQLSQIIAEGVKAVGILTAEEE